jgi:hypothetical protein
MEIVARGLDQAAFFRIHIGLILAAKHWPRMNANKRK